MKFLIMDYTTQVKSKWRRLEEGMDSPMPMLSVSLQILYCTNHLGMEQSYTFA